MIWKSVRGRLGFGLCLVLRLNYAVVMLCRCMFSMDPSPTVSGMVLMKRLILNFRCLDRWRHPGWDRDFPSPHPYCSKQICNKVACIDSLQYSTVIVVWIALRSPGILTIIDGTGHDELSQVYSHLSSYHVGSHVPTLS